jgi:hypothetical protein
MAIVVDEEEIISRCVKDMFAVGCPDSIMRQNVSQFQRRIPWSRDNPERPFDLRPRTSLDQKADAVSRDI